MPPLIRRSQSAFPQVRRRGRRPLRPWVPPEALNGLGEAFLAASQVGQASARHNAALALAIQCGDKYEQARAHSGLASACQAAGDSGQARSHRQALARCTDLGTSEAEQARAQIAVAAEGRPG
jgi:hypothetical protein